MCNTLRLNDGFYFAGKWPNKYEPHSKVFGLASQSDYSSGNFFSNIAHRWLKMAFGVCVCAQHVLEQMIHGDGIGDDGGFLCRRVRVCV